MVIERNVSPGDGGTIRAELKSALYGHAGSPVHGFIAGLGGRDVTYVEMCNMVHKVDRGAAADVEWWGIQD